MNKDENHAIPCPMRIPVCPVFQLIRQVAGLGDNPVVLLLVDPNNHQTRSLEIWHPQTRTRRS